MANESKAKEQLGSELSDLHRRITQPVASETRPKRAEMKLSKSEESSQALVAITSDWEWEIDTKAIHTYVSPKSKDLLGYEPEEIIGKTLFCFMSAEERKRFERKFRAIIESGKPFAGLENTMLHKDGRLVILESSGVPLFDTKGRLYSYRGIGLDITERKQSMKIQKESEEQYRSLVNNVALGIYRSTPEPGGKFLEVNPAMEQIFGYTREELLGMNVSDLYEFPEDRAPLLEKIVLVGSMVNEIRYRKKDGTRFLALDTMVAVKKTDSGKVLYFDGFMEDITKRKQAEEQLRESEEFNSNLLSNSPNPIIVINPDTSIRYVNPALGRLTGFPSAELIGRKVPYPWWPKGTLHKTSSNLEKAMYEGAEMVEELFEKRNGERFWVEATSTPVISNGGLSYELVSWIDITERKQLRENMQFYIGQVTKAQEEERKRIARDLHDDTIQALSVLYSDIDEVRMMGEQLPVEATPRLQQIQAELNRTIKEVRRFSHELRPGLLDRFGLIPSMELLIAEVKKSGLNCRLKVTGSQRRLSSDAELVLFRITQEALTNVKKHAQAMEVLVKVNFMKGKVKLEIIDNGTGFELPEVLGSFARKGKVGIMGMKERTVLLNGNFLVESEVGKGTTVTVEVPV